MSQDVNALGQPLGSAVPDFSPPPFPEKEIMTGRFCRLEPLDVGRHGKALFGANSRDAEGRMWTYLSSGPFESYAEYCTQLERQSATADPSFYAIIDPRIDAAVGVAAYLRIDPPNGVIEVGHLAFSPLLQHTTAATEAMYLMMERAFRLGYRRYEWKCHALNAPSRRAALRLGFTFEGIFRQAVVVKGRNRDTAWYSVIDREWSPLQTAYVRWLAIDNFDERGRQRSALSSLTATATSSR